MLACIPAADLMQKALGLVPCQFILVIEALEKEATLKTAVQAINSLMDISTDYNYGQQPLFTFFFSLRYKKVSA